MTLLRAYAVNGVAHHDVLMMGEFSLAVVRVAVACVALSVGVVIVLVASMLPGFALRSHISRQGLVGPSFPAPSPIVGLPWVLLVWRF